MNTAVAPKVQVPDVAGQITYAMRSMGVAPIPRNYELFYEAYIGSNPALTRDLAALGSQATQAELDALVDAHPEAFFGVTAAYEALLGGVPNIGGFIYLINSAVSAVGGDLTKKDAMREAMRKANYASVRGSYKYGNNHFPIQNFYLQEAVKDGDSFTLKTVGTALKDHQDRYAEKCKMKW